MSFSDAQIVAALLTQAECDRFTVFLTNSRSTAEYQRLGLTNAVTNFGSAEGLTTQNAARTLPTRRPGPAPKPSFWRRKPNSITWC